MYGDPDALDRLADRLLTKAAEVREQAADHVRRGQAAHWVSASAQAYRDRVARDATSVQRAADEMERAAMVLRAHAEELRHTLALIARYEREVTEWFDRQIRSVEDTVEEVVDSAGRVIKRVVADAPWRTWPIGPQDLPGPGDARWLEVGRVMREHGAI